MSTQEFGDDPYIPISLLISYEQFDYKKDENYEFDKEYEKRIHTLSVHESFYDELSY